MSILGTGQDRDDGQGDRRITALHRCEHGRLNTREARQFIERESERQAAAPQLIR
jgi:hypothetical protein